jgi:hypothetical protein
MTHTKAKGSEIFCSEVLDVLFGGLKEQKHCTIDPKLRIILKFF